jgi:hypothetical protein
MADEHEAGSDEEERATSEAVHSPQTGHDSDKLGAVDDTGEKKLHLIILTQRLEERRRVVVGQSQQLVRMACG